MVSWNLLTLALHGSATSRHKRRAPKAVASWPVANETEFNKASAAMRH